MKGSSILFLSLGLFVAQETVAFLPTQNPQVGTVPGDYSLQKQTARKVPSKTTLYLRESPTDGDDVDDANNEDELIAKDPENLMPPSTSIPPLELSDFATAIIPFVAFVSFWPLLAFVRFKLFAGIGPIGNPMDYLDVDKFMALKDLMQEADGSKEIMELPSMSPAEQMVGSFFGPPPSR